MPSLIKTWTLLASLALASLAVLVFSVCAQDSLQPPVSQQLNVNASLLGFLLGNVLYTGVQGGTTLLQVASPILCPLLLKEASDNFTSQPTLYVHNNPLNVNQSTSIAADDAITSELVEAAKFDPNANTFIFIHGWMNGVNVSGWQHRAKNVALGAASDGSGSNGPYRPNVILVDWSEVAALSLFEANATIERMALRLAKMLRQLVELGGLKPKLMHCIGHSFGAHFCGQVARFAFPANSTNLSQRMGRVTGLDPAGQCFNIGAKDESSYSGLRPSDALVVDAFHSNRSPIGNLYNLAQYDVRINNGFFQPGCSTADPQYATEYTVDAISYLFGSQQGLSTVLCDHNYSQDFAFLKLLPVCSYVGYACHSYEDFTRGRCAQCSNSKQCYVMDFEYQRVRASVNSSLEHVANYSSSLNNFSGGQGGQNQSETTATSDGSVPYEDRRVYHIRMRDPPVCTITYRVRVRLNGTTRISANQLSLQFVNAQNQTMTVMPATSDGNATSIDVYGPWSSTNGENYGLDDSTLTAMFQLGSTEVGGTNQVQRSPIRRVVATYDHGLVYSPLKSNPIASITLDYMSSGDQSLRAKLSASFIQGQFTVIYKYLGATVGQIN